MNVYITLDYELFLSKDTGTVGNCLIRPTAALLNCLDKFGIKATFFVDAAFLLRLSQIPVLKVDFKTVCEHVSMLSSAGHSIQLHFHPQWLYSDYEEGKWKMDLEHYKMSDMSDEDVERYLPEAHRLLQSLSSRPIIAFRAGGYSIMDFERYKNLFESLGVIKDTSVLRGRKSQTHFQYYDYSHVPSLSSYSFDNNLCCEDSSGFFMEYPITTKRTLSIITTIKTYIAMKQSGGKGKKWGDGKSISKEREKGNWLQLHWRMLFGKTWEIASIDSFGLSLKSVFKYAQQNIKGEDFVIIGHPKNITPYSLSKLEEFISYIGKDSFKTFE